MQESRLQKHEFLHIEAGAPPIPSFFGRPVTPHVGVIESLDSQIEDEEASLMSGQDFVQASSPRSASPFKEGGHQEALSAMSTLSPIPPVSSPSLSEEEDLKDHYLPTASSVRKARHHRPAMESALQHLPASKHRMGDDDSRTDDSKRMREQQQTQEMDLD
jgi:hypothetical protein